MRKERRIQRSVIAVLVALAMLFCAVPAQAVSGGSNRFNVMVVLDASGSMDDTDPNGLRYEAVSQFTNLLAERGNYLGGIVFSTEVSARQDPVVVNSQQDKEQVAGMLRSVPASGWTNIGGALDAAVNALVSQGDRSLPSVIVFLSDGNTEMETEELTKASLDQKAEALLAARENDIAIYSVCLNADRSADTTEMAQISSSTGGVFQEVGNAESLRDVFNMFYNLIYGTSTIKLVDEVFPASGVVEKEFNIPGIGVEEVNIIIYGKTSSVALFKEDGTQSSAAPVVAPTFTMIKVTDVVPGTWRIVTTGVPGDQIKINMVYNADLAVDIEINDTDGIIRTDGPTVIQAFLRSGVERASSGDQYAGYSAELHLQNGYGDEVEVVPMSVVEDHFECRKELEEGAYFFQVTVSGNYLEKESDTVGPIRVEPAPVSTPSPAAGTASLPKPTPVPTPAPEPPVPVQNPVEKVVYILPFREPELTLKLSDLVVHHSDDELRITVVSSSFLEGEDYTVSEDGTLTQHHFSLSKGAYTIRATNAKGLSCDIEILVKSYNVGVITLIVLGLGALVAAAAIGIVLYLALTRPFWGSITVCSYHNGTYRKAERSRRRGRCKLSVFGVDNIGLNYSKAYFQATGKPFIYLVTKEKVVYNGQETNRVRIQSGMQVTIASKKNSNDRLEIRFDSRIRGTSRRGRRGFQAGKR